MKTQKITLTIVIIMVLLVSWASVAQANLTFQMVKDTDHAGTAVLAGFIDIPTELLYIEDLGPGRGYIKVLLAANLKVIGQKWNVTGTIQQYQYFDFYDNFQGDTFLLALTAQHRVAGSIGAGHDDELVPNPLFLGVQHDNLSGLDLSTENVPPPVSNKIVLSHKVPHLVGDHFDSMTLSISDLNGGEPGVIDDLGQIAMVINMSHPIPAPGAVGLVVLGIALVSRLRRNQLQ